MRYQVPQFVDIEDKIIGPLTLKQFLTYLAAVMLLVPVYLFSDLSLFLIIAAPVMALAALLAHGKFNGQTIPVLINNAVVFLLHGQLSIWRRLGHDKLLQLSGPEYKLVEPDNGEAVSTLSKYARQLETYGNVVAEDDLADPLNPTE